MSDELETETFERSFSFWDAGIAPEELVGCDELEIRVTDARMVGDRGNEELRVQFEVRHD